MLRVTITELRRNLPTFLNRIRAGARIEVTRRGRVVARITPAMEQGAHAKRQLEALRKKAFVGDVESPVDGNWEADGRP